MNNGVFIIRGNILIVVEKTHDKKNRRKRSNQKYQLHEGVREFGIIKV